MKYQLFYYFFQIFRGCAKVKSYVRNLHFLLDLIRHKSERGKQPSSFHSDKSLHKNAFTSKQFEIKSNLFTIIPENLKFLILKIFPIFRVAEVSFKHLSILGSYLT